MFEDSGVGSRAWWLTEIKKREDETGAKKKLAEEHELDDNQIKQVFDNLVGTGHIQMSGSARNGFKYFLTSFGNRYLNEHRDELLDDFEPLEVVAPKPPKPVKPVIITPAPKYTPPERPEATPLVPAPPVAPAAPEPDDEDPEPIEHPVPAEQAAPATLYPDAKGHAKSVLNDLLIERFGDQITAKDLIEAM